MFREQSISINSVIADYFVNEIFGDNMISLTSDDVKQWFGPLVARKLALIVAVGAIGGKAFEVVDLYGEYP